jgi:hypothetical protein
MIITAEQFNTAYSKLPFVLREYIADDDLTTITEQVGKEHQLHVDTIGALYRETTNMLLGLINPTQFVGELKSVGVPEESIGAIVQELNEKVFIPLREKMKNQTQEPEEEDEDDEVLETASSAPAAAANFVPPDPEFVQHDSPAPTAPAPKFEVPPYTPPVPTPTPVQTPSAYVPQNLPTYTPSAYEAPVLAVQAPIQTPPPTPAPISMPVQSAPSIPVPTPASATMPAPTSAPVQIPASPVPQAPIPEPHARTMQEDMAEMKAMQEHNPQKYSLTPEPARSYSAPSVPTSPRPIPSASPMPTREPFTPPAPVVSATIPTPAQQSDNRDALHAVLKSYGVDPYREPPE